MLNNAFSVFLSNKYFPVIFQTQSTVRSKADRFRDKLAELLNVEPENVDVFSVQLRRKYPPLTDVRFSAHSSPYYKPVKLNGLVLLHREEVLLILPFYILGFYFGE